MFFKNNFKIPEDFDWKFYLNKYDDLKKAGLKTENDAKNHYIKYGRYEKRIYKKKLSYDDWLLKYGYLSDKKIKKYKNDIKRLKYKPKISIIMPVYNPPIIYLKKAIESVINQIYDNWELCISDDLSNKNVIKVLKEYESKYNNIKVVYRKENGHISRASNTALEISKGDYIALVDNDDIISPDALYWIVKELNKNDNIFLIYTDEDKIDKNDKRFDPYFKTDWNYDLLLSQNYISHLSVYKSSIVKEIGGFNIGMEGSQDWDLTLRFIEKINKNQIKHIPRVLYHWRAIKGSTAYNINEKDYIIESSVKAVEGHIKRKKINASVEYNKKKSSTRVIYNLIEKPSVSIIIPTKDKIELLEKCVNSILSKTSYENYNIIIVSNSIYSSNLIKLFNNNKKISVLIDDTYPFNFSKVNNNAVKLTNSDYLIFMNDDTEIISENWLKEMLSIGTQKGVGAVGAKLLYPNGNIQHGGVILINGVASHAHKNKTRYENGYFNKLNTTQNYIAVTGACLLINRKIFLEVNGFEEELKIAFNDIDFCLKLYEKGYRNVWTPYSELYHHESMTRTLNDSLTERHKKEAEYMKKKWSHYIECDPFLNPNLSNSCENFSLSEKPRIKY